MKNTQFKIETWQILFMCVTSAFAVVILNSLSFGFTADRVFDSLIHTFFIASSVSIVILYLAPKIYNLSISKRMAILIPVIFIATIIGIVLTRIFLTLINYNSFNFLNIVPGFKTVIFSLIISYVFGFSTYFYIHSQNKLHHTKELLKQKELDEAKAKSLAITAQLASLESRIHPHFLFNTLNSIAALINESPDKAEKTVEKLSALLRYSLSFEPNKLVTLAEELKITKDYLDIESTRFGEKLKFKFDIEEDITNDKVPAFALQTLVENSIKHVASKRSAKTSIDISAHKTDSVLKIEVSDNGDSFSENDIKNGHGLDNLRKRLKNIFGDKADLHIISGGKVSLEIRVC